jgi:hypothetical protein
MRLDGSNQFQSTEEKFPRLTIEQTRLLSHLAATQSHTVPSQEILDRIYRTERQSVPRAVGRILRFVSAHFRLVASKESPTSDED